MVISKFKRIASFFKSGDNTLYDKLEEPLFRYPGTKDDFRFSHSMGHVCIFGATRVGKSSSVYRKFLMSWAQKDQPMIIFTTRVNEPEIIRGWLEDAGCGDRVTIFDHDSDYSLNFLELENMGSYSDSMNIVNKLLNIHEVISNYQSGGGSSKGEEEYWITTTSTLLIQEVELCKLAGISISPKILRRVAYDAFTVEDLKKYEELSTILKDRDHPEWEDAFEQMAKWRFKNLFLDCLETINLRDDLNEEELEKFQDLWYFFMVQWPKFAEETKSIVLSIVDNICRPFETSPVLKKNFGRGVSPEIHPDRLIKDGKIIIVGFGAKKHKLSGVVATTIVKLCFQDAIEARDIVAESIDAKKILMAQDEFIFYSNPARDNLFLSTSGGSLCCNLVVSQSLNHVIVGMKGDENMAKAFLNNFSCKIFCCNTGMTNEWASTMISDHLIETETTKISESGETDISYSQTIYRKVPVAKFTILKTGRKENNYKVGTIITHTGFQWSDGENYQEVEFDQNF